MSTLPDSLKCNLEFTCEAGAMYVYPECAHEWSKAVISALEVCIREHDEIGLGIEP